MKVYLKEDIPARFHYQHNDRIQPIILVADEGWTIVLNKSSLKRKQFFRIFLLNPRHKSTCSDIVLLTGYFDVEMLTQDSFIFSWMLLRFSSESNFLAPECGPTNQTFSGWELNWRAPRLTLEASCYFAIIQITLFNLCNRRTDLHH